MTDLLTFKLQRLLASLQCTTTKHKQLRKQNGRHLHGMPTEQRGGLSFRINSCCCCAQTAHCVCVCVCVCVWGCVGGWGGGVGGGGCGWVGDRRGTVMYS